MKCVQLKDVTPGMVLGREIVSCDGVNLLEKNTRLIAAHIENLRVWKIPFVYILREHGEMPPDINMSRAAFLQEYKMTARIVRAAFQGIREAKIVPIQEMQALVNKSILAMVNTVGIMYYLHEVQRHSDYTFQHSINVSVVSGVLGKWLNFSVEEGQSLMLSGLLHDIGKLFIPLPILDKPEKLSAIEFDAVKRHPEDGHRLLENSRDLPLNVRMGILQHHERFDGSGYPDGVTGDAIHRFASIVSIADMYDAMVSDRTYRRKFTPLKAVETIAEEMFEKLDASICFTFLENMRSYFAGNTVILSNGIKAKIIVVDSLSWTRPLVQTMDGAVIDLKKEQISIIDFVTE
jgi:HD-GYP domain-containing protein (c-di-GMP phosphodiesterase class II)